MKREKRFVFISFTSAQAEVAERISHALQKIGVTCFYSNESLSPGEVAMNVISGKLFDNKCLLIPIYSNEYFDPSKMSLMEFTGFINKYRHKLYGRICPIRLDMCEVPDFYRTINWIEADTSSLTDYLPKIVESVSGLISVSVDDPPPRDVSLEKSLSAIAQMEWDKILKHATATELSTRNNSQRFIFGWVACCEGNIIDPDPMITAIIVNSMIDKLYFDVVRNNPKHFSSEVCTIRYLLSCHLVACRKTEYPSTFIDALADGLQTQDDQSLLHLRQAKSQAEKLVRPVVGVVIEDVGREILRSLGAAARTVGVNLQTIYDEELSRDRVGMRSAKLSRVETENKATHEIKLYMQDRPNIYYDVMDVIRKEVHFNIIQSISETLVPEMLALVRLKVAWHDRHLASKISDAIRNEREVQDRVFDISVSSIPA